MNLCCSYRLQNSRHKKWLFYNDVHAPSFLQCTSTSRPCVTWWVSMATARKWCLSTTLELVDQNPSEDTVPSLMTSKLRYMTLVTSLGRTNEDCIEMSVLAIILDDHGRQHLIQYDRQHTTKRLKTEDSLHWNQRAGDCWMLTTKTCDSCHILWWRPNFDTIDFNLHRVYSHCCVWISPPTPF